MQHKRDTIAISLFSTCYLTYDRTVSGKHATRLQVSICCIFLFRSPVEGFVWQSLIVDSLDNLRDKGGLPKPSTAIE